MLEQIINFIAYTISIFFGKGDELLYALVLFLLLDYATGICAAIYHHRLSSSIGSKGITKKVIIFLVVSVAHTASKSVTNFRDALEAHFGITDTNGDKGLMLDGGNSSSLVARNHYGKRVAEGCGRGVNECVLLKETT